MRGQRAHVVGVAGDNDRTDSGSDEHNVGVDDVNSSCLCEQRADGVSVGATERDDIATSKEPSQLRLPRRTARLRNDRGRRDGNKTRLKPSTVIGPDQAVVAVSGDEHAGVIQRAHADRLPGLVNS